MMHALSLNSEEIQTIEKLLEKLSRKSGQTITLDGLIKSWMSFVSSVERGYSDSIYEYANDLSVRDMLDDILVGVQEMTRSKITDILHPWDVRFEQATKEIGRPIVAGAPDTKTRWYRIPKRPTDELESDLRMEGIIE